jgi:hypothetical protein
MSIEYLGERFDLHTGGVDHIPVHHTKEIAQSEAYLGGPWVPFWLHNEFINLAQAKIAKSTGKTLRLSDLEQSGYHPLSYRYLLLSSHYRSQIDFTWEGLEAVRVGHRRLLERIRERVPGGGRPLTHGVATAQLGRRGHAYLARIDAAISNDLNTPQALAVLTELSRDTTLATDEFVVLVSAAEDCSLSDSSTSTATASSRGEHRSNSPRTKSNDFSRIAPRHAAAETSPPPTASATLSSGGGSSCATLARGPAGRQAGRNSALLVWTDGAESSRWLGLSRPTRGAVSQRLLHGIVAIVAVWTIVASVVFDGTALKWLSAAEALALVAVAIAGLASTRSVSRRRSVRRPTRPWASRCAPQHRSGGPCFAGTTLRNTDGRCTSSGRKHYSDAYNLALRDRLRPVP